MTWIQFADAHFVGLAVVAVLIVFIIGASIEGACGDDREYKQ